MAPVLALFAIRCRLTVRMYRLVALNLAPDSSYTS